MNVNPMIALQMPCHDHDQNPDHDELELVFGKKGDRWQHCWRFGPESKRTAFLESIEGTADQDWPPSPPLQDIDRHVLATGAAVLGVGMAGKSHWSASFSISPDPIGEPAIAESKLTTQVPLIIRSDLACLQKSENAECHLGSDYRIADACQIQSATDQQVVLNVSGTNICLKAFTNDECRTCFQLNGQTLSIRPMNIIRKRSVATRWGFDVMPCVRFISR